MGDEVEANQHRRSTLLGRQELLIDGPGQATATPPMLSIVAPSAAPSAAPTVTLLAVAARCLRAP